MTRYEKVRDIGNGLEVAHSGRPFTRADADRPKTEQKPKTKRA